MKNLEDALSVEQLEERYEMSSLLGCHCFNNNEIHIFSDDPCPAYD